MIENWATTKADSKLISRIARRAAADFAACELTKEDIEMAITACHANGCPLRLADLLASDELNFGHDVLGIHRNIDRETGALKDNFWPRFAGRVLADE